MTDKEILQQREWKGDDLYTLTVTNNKTGKVEFNFHDVEGGIFIIRQKSDPSPIGTYQVCFGAATIVALCAAKAPAIFRDILKKLDCLDLTRRLVKKMNLPTSIV